MADGDCTAFKTCTQCGEPKSHEAFSPQRRQCRDCIRANDRSKYAENAVEIRAKKLAYYYRKFAENPERIVERNRGYFLAKPEMATSAEYKRKRYLSLSPEEKRAMISALRAWNKENQPRRTAGQRKREAKKLNATPAWANESLIVALYLEAKRLTDETGIPHEVDHIVPLVSKLVCGLHVEANLSVITALENLKKLNRYWPDMP